MWASVIIIQHPPRDRRYGAAPRVHTRGIHRELRGGLEETLYSKDLLQTQN